MAMVVPESWLKSAVIVLERDRHGTEGAIDSETAEQLVTHFRDQEFRDRYFLVIGHKYVLALHRMLTVVPSTKRFTQAQWRTKLGVNKTTIWRWKNDVSCAAAEKFFAVQLLMVDIPLTNLCLPNNDEMLAEAVVAMSRHLKARYDPLNDAEPITLKVFRIVQYLMLIMSQSREALYNPYSKTQSARSGESALKVLASHLATKSSLTKQSKVLPSHIKLWLDGWGMTYTLFAMGNRLGWKQLQAG